MSSLVPCPKCTRHVRRSETACPFCGAGVTDAMARAPERAMPTMRLGRSALFVFAAASVGAAGCGGDTGTDTSKTGVKGDAATTGGASNTGGYTAMALYGAPAPTGGTTGAGGAGAKGGNVGTGGEMAIPAYGLPAFTGGRPGTDTDAGDASAPKGTGGTFSALYGGPPHNLYGAPPAPKQ